MPLLCPARPCPELCPVPPRSHVAPHTVLNSSQLASAVRAVAGVDGERRGGALPEAAEREQRRRRLPAGAGGVRRQAAGLPPVVQEAGRRGEGLRRRRRQQAAGGGAEAGDGGGGRELRRQARHDVGAHPRRQQGGLPNAAPRPAALRRRGGGFVPRQLAWHALQGLQARGKHMHFVISAT
jgi:hypothetical protein